MHARLASIALVTLLAAPATAQPCVLAGEDVALRRVIVRPPGEPAFAIDAFAERVTVRPTRLREAVLSIVGPVAFEAHAKVETLPFSLATDVVTGRGTVRISRGLLDARVSALRSTVGGVRARLVGWGVSMDVDLPCHALSVGPSEELWSSAAPALVGDREADVARLAVHPSPDAPAGVLLRRLGEIPLRLRVLARRRGWVRVRAAPFSGVVVEGWVRRAALRTRPLALVGAIGSAGAGWGYGLCGAGPPRADAYEGEAVVSPRTPIRTRPGGPIWGHTRDGDSVYVSARRADGWVQILGWPRMGFGGGAGCPAPAWVPRARVRLNVARRGGYVLRGPAPFTDEAPGLVTVERIPAPTPLGLRLGDVVIGASPEELAWSVSPVPGTGRLLPRRLRVRAGARVVDRWLLHRPGAEPSMPSAWQALAGPAPPELASAPAPLGLAPPRPARLASRGPRLDRLR